jgi:hypothetical protein
LYTLPVENRLLPLNGFGLLSFFLFALMIRMLISQPS